MLREPGDPKVAVYKLLYYHDYYLLKSDLLFFIEKIIYTSSNSSHKSLKKNISSLILNSKTTKLKETRLLDVVGKIKFQYFSKIKNKNFFRNSFFKLVFDGFF